jgi:hypothetical protein
LLLSYLASYCTACSRYLPENPKPMLSDGFQPDNAITFVVGMLLTPAPSCTHLCLLQVLVDQGRCRPQPPQDCIRLRGHSGGPLAEQGCGCRQEGYVRPCAG